jgi:tripartite-type tricarboxylate transporter receptor subunit TctC
LPDVPTTAELGYPAILASNTYSLFAPPKTPPEIISRLDQLVQAALRDADVRATFVEQAATPAADTPEQFGKTIREEAARWIPIVKAAGIKPD